MEQKRKDFQENHQKILEAYMEAVAKAGVTGKAPNITQLAKDTGMTRASIYRHIDKFQLNDFSRDIKATIPNILEALKQKALTGDVNAIKLYLTLGGVWNEKTISENININKSIELKFGNLSIDDVKKIVNNEAIDTPEQITEYEDVTDD